VHTGAAGEKGTQSLACFCGRADLCLDYDSARSKCRDGARIEISDVDIEITMRATFPRLV
jgi:hypothetical protein